MAIVDENDKHFNWSWKFGHFLNHLRIIPRVALAFYMYVFWQMVQWFLALPDPTTQQAAFVSTIVGASAAFFGLYTRSGTGGEK
jgi:hypothetical protein